MASGRDGSQSSDSGYFTLNQRQTSDASALRPRVYVIQPSSTTVTSQRVADSGYYSLPRRSTQARTISVERQGGDLVISNGVHGPLRVRGASAGADDQIPSLPLHADRARLRRASRK